MRGIADCRVTVAICVRDGAQYLDEALQSAINQSLKPYELILIDDGSEDETVSIAHSRGCVVFSQPPAGIGRARNKAFEVAQGEFVFFLDADDLMPARSLELLLRSLESAPDASGAIGFRQNFISPELVRSISMVRQDFLEKERGLLPSGSLWRKEVGRQIRFIEDSRVADVQWVLDFRDSGSLVEEVDDIVLLRRIHLTNHSARAETRKDYLSLARRQIRKV